jgi:hypothetical protein
MQIEEHFVLHCPAYADSRSAAFKKLENYITNIQNYHYDKKLQQTPYKYLRFPLHS